MCSMMDAKCDCCCRRTVAEPRHLSLVGLALLVVLVSSKIVYSGIVYTVTSRCDVCIRSYGNLIDSFKDGDRDEKLQLSPLSIITRGNYRKISRPNN